MVFFKKNYVLFLHERNSLIIFEVPEICRRITVAVCPKEEKIENR